MSSRLKKSSRSAPLSVSPLVKNALVLAIGSAIATGALAQVVPTPGTVFESVRPAAPQAPKPQLDPAVVPAAGPVLQNLDPNAPRTPVSGFRIVGNVSIDAPTLHALVDGKAGQSYNLHELNQLARLITDHYQAQGFPVARAVIPAQKVENGVVTIEVIEGKIDQMRFQGNALYSDELLARWAAPMVGQQVRIEPLEERVLKINDLPGIQIRPVLAPGGEYGTTTVETVVQERRYDGQISLNNHGRNEVGEIRSDASFNLNNPFGIGDQLSFRGSLSEDTLIKMGGLNYSLPIGVEGTRLSFSYTAVDYSIGGALRALDINGKTALGAISVTHPFVRQQKENLFGIFSVRSFNGEQMTTNIPISDNEVVVMEGGFAWNRIDANANVTSAALRVSTNFKSSLGGARNNGHKLKIDGEVSHLQRLSPSWDLRFAGAVQWAPDTLSDAEQFSLGGPNSVRGYPAADVRGDRGAFASIEARYRVQFGSIPGYVSSFFDAGYTARVNPALNARRSNTISSAGFGLTLFPTPSVIVELAAAAPTSSLDPSDPNRKNGRAWLNLTKTF